MSGLWFLHMTERIIGLLLAVPVLPVPGLESSVSLVAYIACSYVPTTVFVLTYRQALRPQTHIAMRQ
jgi:hypothetical protein